MYVSNYYFKFISVFRCSSLFISANKKHPQHHQIAFHIYINLYIIKTVSCSLTFNATVEIDILVQTNKRGGKKNRLNPEFERGLTSDRQSIVSA